MVRCFNCHIDNCGIVPCNCLCHKKERQKDADFLARLEEETRLGHVQVAMKKGNQRYKGALQNMAEEKDPNGKSQHEPGSKLDEGKPLPQLVLGNFPRALKAVTNVGTKGSRKYTPKGWETVPNGIERYGEAQMRHWLEEMCGEEIDPESGEYHLAHQIWNACARLELILKEKGEL